MDKNCTSGKVQMLHAALRRVPHWLLSALCLLVILWLTLAPHPLGDTELELFPGADKVVHGLMFFGLTLCLLLDMKRAQKWARMKLPLISAMTLLGMGIGIGIELVQPLFGRAFEFRDMGADAFGAVLAGALWTLMDGALTIDDKLKANNDRESKSV